MSAKVTKCSRKSFCDALARRSNDETRNPRQKGFAVVELFNMNTGKGQVIGVRYRETARSKGIMLNRCPWCGETLRFWEDLGVKSKPASSTPTKARG